MIATAVSAEGCARVPGAFLAGVTITIVLSVVMGAAASCADQNVGRAASARVSPRLTLPAEGLRRELDPPFARPHTAREINHCSHKSSTNASRVVVNY